MMQSFSPQESSSDLFIERALFSGSVVANVVYGIHVCVVTMIFFSTRGHNMVKMPRSLACGVFLLFALATIVIVCEERFFNIMWIDQRNIPGGPITWVGLEHTIISGILGNAAFSAASFIADSILIYRMFVIWGNNYYIIILPALSNVASAILSGFATWQSIHTGINLASHDTLIPYFVLTISLNIFLSLTIMARLLAVRRSIIAAVGAEHAKTYTSLSAMIVESAALTSVTGIFSLACIIRGSPVQNFILAIHDQVTCLAPQLISLRVALGRAWTSKTSEDALTTLKFRQSVSKPHSAAQSNFTSISELHDSEVTMTRRSDGVNGDGCV